MSFASRAQLWAATMVNNPFLYFDAPLFNPKKVCWFPVAIYVDHDGEFPCPLPSGHIQYFERQRRCSYLLGYLIRGGVVGFCGTWSAQSYRSSRRRRLDELVFLKIQLLAGP